MAAPTNSMNPMGMINIAGTLLDSWSTNYNPSQTGTTVIVFGWTDATGKINSTNLTVNVG